MTRDPAMLAIFERVLRDYADEIPRVVPTDKELDLLGLPGPGRPGGEYHFRLVPRRHHSECRRGRIVARNRGARVSQMSLVLVNIRASLSEAVSRGLLARPYADQVIDVARSIYYPERQVSTILRYCKDLQVPVDALTAIERALTVDHVDLKRSDAREMLTLLNEVIEGSAPRPKRVEFEFNRSSVFETLYNLDRRIRIGDTQVSLQSIRERERERSTS